MAAWTGFLSMTCFAEPMPGYDPDAIAATIGIRSAGA